MKKLLTLFVPILLTSNLAAFAQPKEKVEVNQNIVGNLNINENKTFSTSNSNLQVSGEVLNKVFYFNYLNYATNINNFIAKYPHFSFNTSSYMHVSMYTSSKTVYLNSVYNTSSLIGPTGLLADTAQANYNYPNEYSGIQLQAIFGVTNNQIGFLVSYGVFAPIFSPKPSYSLNISSLTFLSS